MEIRSKLFIPALCIILLFLFAAPSLASDITIIADWISRLQYSDPSHPSYGAIKIHHTPGYIDPNNNVYCLVSPYNSHIAVLGLLDSDAGETGWKLPKSGYPGILITSIWTELPKELYMITGTLQTVPEKQPRPRE